MKPLIYPIKTPFGYYFYETQRNEIIAVNEELYERIVNWDSEEELVNGQTESKTTRAVEELRELGYLREPYIEKLEHPATKYLGIILERKISKILLQLTQRCNLRCNYCVYSEEKNFGTRNHSNKDMSYETAKKAIDFYMEHSVDCEEKAISFYGGEPLLQFDLIKKIITYCNDVFRGHKIIYSITTNGTLLTDEIMDFLVKNQVYITVSFDGPKKIHDKNRRFVNGTGSYDVVIKNLERLKHKCENKMKCTVNMVVDPDNDYQEICNFFHEPIVKGLNVHWNMVEEDNDIKRTGDQFASAYEYQTFLGYVRYFREKNFDAPDGLVKETFEGRAISDFHLQAFDLPRITAPGGPCVPGKMRLMADCDGNLFPCERVSETSSCMKVGSLDTGFNLEKVSKLLNVSQITEECKNCWAFTLCSVCAKHASDGDILCAELKRKQCPGARVNAWKQIMERILLYENMIHKKKIRKKKRDVLNKEKVCIVPFTKNEIPLLACMPDNYEISSIVSAGTELEGKEISFLTNREKFGVVASKNWKKGIRECDTVIVTDIGMEKERHLGNLLFDIISQALDKRKKVICFSELEEARIQEFKILASQNDAIFTYACAPYMAQKKMRFERIRFKAPIIFLGEMTQECDGYEIALRLMERLKQDNLRGVLISENKYNALYEHQYFTKFYAGNILEYSIEEIKTLVNEIEEEENPDAIILKLPWPMTAFDHNIPYDYGIHTFIISQAVHADYCVYCGLSGMFSGDFISNINEHFRYKFGYPIDAFHISNQILDIVYEPQEKAKTIYIPVDRAEKEAKTLREHSRKPIYQMLDEDEFELFYQKLKRELFDFSCGRI